MDQCCFVGSQEDEGVRLLLELEALVEVRVLHPTMRWVLQAAEVAEAAEAADLEDPLL